MTTLNNSNYSPAQYNLQVGDVNGLIANVSPNNVDNLMIQTATVPGFGQLPVAHGGTGTDFFTTNSMIITNGANAISSSPRKVNSSGILTDTGQLAFIAFPSATLTNKTGDGTDYLIILNSIVANQGSRYSTSTGVFTPNAIGTPLYYFHASIVLSGLTSSFTSVKAYFKGTNDSVYFAWNNVGQIIDSGTIKLNGSCLLSLASGNTVSLHVVVAGSTKTINVVGGRNNTYFSGMLVT